MAILPQVHGFIADFHIMIITRDTLGIGLYTPEEAAFYARVSLRLLNHWLFSDGDERVIAPQIRDQSDDDRVVTFMDLVQALAVRTIRLDFKIPLHKIRTAVRDIQEKHGIEYPFAREHTTYLRSDRKRKGHGEILIRLPGITEADDRFVEVSGSGRGNFVMKPILESYLDELTFDKRGFAMRYKPFNLDSQSIILDPHVRLGEPIVESCGYTAQTLWETVFTEGSISAAALACGVDESCVRVALKYHDHLNGIAA